MTAAHIALVGAAMLSASIRGCRQDMPVSVYTPVSLVMEASALRPVMATPPPDNPPPQHPPAEEPMPTRPTEVRPSPQRGPLVHRPRPASTPRLNANDIRQALELPPATPGRAGPVDELDTTYRRIIEEVFYRSWRQPSYADAGNATASASIQLGSSGLVTGRKLSRPSGNAVLDASVLKALDSVARIPGLSRSYIEQHPTVELVFSVEKE